MPLVVLAGKEYGSGSSRDWAAKGTALLGRARRSSRESYERIHRSNLIGMGVLPLQFPDGETAESLGLTGEETFSITGRHRAQRRHHAAHGHGEGRRADGDATSSRRSVRIDTPGEADYYRNGGIMQYVLRQLLASEPVELPTERLLLRQWRASDRGPFAALNAAPRGHGAISRRS